MQFRATKPFISRTLSVIAVLVVLLTSQTMRAAALRILPLGDSITDGFSIPGGYRAPLYRMLTNAGFTVDFLGTQRNNSAALLADPDHEGHSGYRIDQIAAALPAWLEAVEDPDVILLLIGTNDYGQNDDPDHAIDRLERLIRQLVGLRPGARIIVANLLPRIDNPGADAAIQRGFNPLVRDVVSRHAAQGERVFFLDMRSALGTDDLADGLHPNQTGYEKMATNWFGMISKVVACEKAGQFVIDFDGASVDGSLNHVRIPDTYQPVPGLTIRYLNTGIFNRGPDHTTGLAAGAHYNTFSLRGDLPQSFVFSRAISLSQVCLTTFDGRQNGGKNDVTLSAYSDPEGSQLITNLTFATPAHAFGGQYQWARIDGLIGLGSKIMRLDFTSPGNPQVDDMAIGLASDLGRVRALRLKLLSAELHEHGVASLNATADYEYAANVNVTASARVEYASTDTNVVIVSDSGRVTGIRAGHATVTARLGGVSVALPITVAPGVLMDFNTGLENVSNRTPLTEDYQPIPGVTLSYENVAVFNGGPDRTTGIVGANRFNTYQLRDGLPQVFKFSMPVSIPSLWLTTFTGGGDPVTLKAYADELGNRPLGVVRVSTKTFPGADRYLWSGCTSLNDPVYNEKIHRLEVFTESGVNANVDDITVIVSTNSGALRAVEMKLPDGPFYPGMKVPASILADYENFGDPVVMSGGGVLYASSDTAVVRVDSNGLLSMLSSGRAIVTAKLGGMSCRQDVSVLPGHRVDFSLPAGNVGNKVALPNDYQPVPGLIMEYENVGVFHGGPDHTTGKMGGNHYNTYQQMPAKPQVFKFSFPVGIPTLSLATFQGSGEPITVSAYADVDGKDLIGSVFVIPPRSKGEGHYVWTQCTNLNSAAFRGKIRRLEVSGPDNANLDDLVIENNSQRGRFRGISMTLPIHEFVPGMSRQATVLANFEHAQGCDVSRMPEVTYRSNDESVATVTQAGLVRAMAGGEAQIVASYLGHEQSVRIRVRSEPGQMVCFDELSAFGNRVLLPSSYQPVPGVTLGYINVGIYNEGPDHTAGIIGGGNCNTYQYRDGAPQVFTFSKPVSLPMLWLSTYWGSGDQVTLSAYADREGRNLLGTLFVSTPVFPGPGNYRWVECTNLNTAAFNGRIRRLELLGNTGNVQLDDMLVR